MKIHESPPLGRDSSTSRTPGGLNDAPGRQQRAWELDLGQNALGGRDRTAVRRTLVEGPPRSKTHPGVRHITSGARAPASSCKLQRRERGPTRPRVIPRVGSTSLEFDSSLPELPAAARAKLASALGSGGAPDGHASLHLVRALHHAFVSALAAGLKVSAAAAFVGALLALWLVRPARRQHAGTRPSGQRAPEAITA